MDEDLLQARLDYFHDLGYIAYHSDTKAHHLLPTTLLVVCKVFAMYHTLSFPTVNAHIIRNTKTPKAFTTELGDKIFKKYLSTFSPALFEMVLPIFKGSFTPATFLLSDTRTMQNLEGLVGDTTRTKPKPPVKVHVLIDNSEPFEYLNAEYIYDSMYEARTFINKLVAYIPPSRIELWRVRTDLNTGAIRRDKEPVLISKRPYKM